MKTFKIIKNLYKKWVFYILFYRHRFIEAIAIATTIQNPKSLLPALSYCYYRSGLYQSAINLNISLNSKHNSNYYLSQAVSHAACGNKEQCLFYIQYFQAKSPSKRQYVMLIRGVGNHFSDIALDILNSIDNTNVLMVSLFYRVYKHSNALKLLNGIYFSDTNNLSLSLIKSNLINDTPRQQLDTINSIYQSYNLFPVHLLNKCSPLSTKNISTDNTHQKTSGPLVTILMTAFNSEERIAHSVRSLLAQTYKNIEIIIIDDASNDNTVQIIKSLSKQDSRIRFITLSKNVGTYVAKNLGFKYAKGEFTTCHDSDDWAHPEKIERQVRPLINNRKLICTTSLWIRLEDNGKFFSRQVYPYIRLNPASPLFRRNIVLQTTGMWDCVRIGADSEFLARLQLVFGKNAVVQIPLPLALGSHHENSLMTVKTTGYDQYNISKSRLNYTESWGHWHIQQIAQGKTLKMPDMLFNHQTCDTLPIRPFLVSQELLINQNHIKLILSDKIST